MEKYIEFIVQDIRAGVTIIFTCMVLVCAATMIDLWSGIDAARANNERIKSRPLRKTGQKILDYYKLLFIFLLVDILGVFFPWYSLPYAVVLCTAGVLFVEGFSVVENLRKKKSAAAQVADVAAKIVECLTKEDAEKIIQIIKDNHKEMEEKK